MSAGLENTLPLGAGARDTGEREQARAGAEAGAVTGAVTGRSAAGGEIEFVGAGDGNAAAVRQGTAATREPGLERWRGLVAYDGGGFSGWQSQVDGNAVQDHLERRLAEIFKVPIHTQGSGRTDAGVHARGQVFHFDAVWKHDPQKLLNAFRAGLPPTIQVRSVQRTTPDFHARYSARGKIYTYHLHHGGFADPFAHRYCWSIPLRLEVAAMRSAAARLVGRQDFRAFSALNREEPVGDTVRTLRRLAILGAGARLRVVAEGDGFLYKMVRSLVGALAFVGMGRLTVQDIADLLASRERGNRIVTAPPEGLFLTKVFYRERPDAAPGQPAV